MTYRQSHSFVDPALPEPPRLDLGGTPSGSSPGRRARERLWLALDRRCGICGGRIRSAVKVTIDHVIPRAKNGGNVGNRVAAHMPCNFKKADRDPTGCERIMLIVTNIKLGIDTRN